MAITDESKYGFVNAISEAHTWIQLEHIKKMQVRSELLVLATELTNKQKSVSFLQRINIKIELNC
jgi:hypothetical protein